LITPRYLDFKVKSNLVEKKIYSGMLINYSIRPFWGIKMDWVSEISHVKEFEYFVDHQVIGPYAFWHHQHLIKDTKEGLIMEDVVSYKPPFGIFGQLLNQQYLKYKIDEIFNHRALMFDSIFKKKNSKEIIFP
jgi:ligand-binding SRPBCC domain-containing protein